MQLQQPLKTHTHTRTHTLTYVCVLPVVGLLSLNNAFCHFLYAKVIQNSNQVRSHLHAHLHTHTHPHPHTRRHTLLLLLLVLPPSWTVAYFESLSDIVCKFLARHKLKLNELTSFSSLHWNWIPTPTPAQPHRRTPTHTHRGGERERDTATFAQMSHMQFMAIPSLNWSWVEIENGRAECSL